MSALELRHNILVSSFICSFHILINIQKLFGFLPINLCILHSTNLYQNPHNYGSLSVVSMEKKSLLAINFKWFVLLLAWLIFTSYLNP